MNGYTFRHVARMEWIKLRTLPSVRWTLLLGMIATVALGVVAGYNTRNVAGDPTSNVLSGVVLGQVITGVLGVLAISGEFGSGMTGATFAAVPRRGLVLTAKAVVWGATFLVAGEAALLTAFLAGIAALRAGVPHPSLASADVARAVLMTGVYLALVCLMGLGIATLLRHGGASIAVVIGGLFVAPLIIGAAQHGFGKLLPELIAGNSLAAVKPVPGFTWSPWIELGIVALYPAILLTAAGWLLARRDA